LFALRNETLDLRHSFALPHGLLRPIIGTLPGHSCPETTQGYAHLLDRHAMEAAKSIDFVVKNALEGREWWRVCKRLCSTRRISLLSILVSRGYTKREIFKTLCVLDFESQLFCIP
jgi:hypothetical protein